MSTPVKPIVMWHVADGAWNGCDLQPLCEWMTRDEARRYIAEKWPRVDFDEYWWRDARSVHLYPDYSIACDYAEDGDTIVAVDVTGLQLQMSDWEDPAYPLVVGSISAARCSVAT